MSNAEEKDKMLFPEREHPVGFRTRIRNNPFSLTT